MKTIRTKNIIKYISNLIYFISVEILDMPMISDTVFIAEFFSFQVSICGSDIPYDISWIVSRIYNIYISKKLMSFLSLNKE